MYFRKWYKARGPRFIWQRAGSLLRRYGVTPRKAVRRVEHFMETLAAVGCAPTFPTPGAIVGRYPRFILRLQDMGAEIAVHGYQHVDLTMLPVEDAVKQLVKAAHTFDRYGLNVCGFRCPYVGRHSALLEAVPDGLFQYSSNYVIQWDLPEYDGDSGATQLYGTLEKFYRMRPAAETICVPWDRGNFLEIPVCVPDDLQLTDGLNFDTEDIAQAWNRTLHLTHQRGELYTLLTHPELAGELDMPFAHLLQEARRIQPSVWIVRLCDVSDWWREKHDFRTAVEQDATSLHLSFKCSSRATILARGLDVPVSQQAWDGAYFRLRSTSLDVPATPRPFVGLPANVPARVVSFLENQGYILDTTETAPQCGVYLSTETLAGLTNDVQIVKYIEESPGPLVRYWRWPDGAKSALSVTGDLDALALLDYAARPLGG